MKNMKNWLIAMLVAISIMIIVDIISYLIKCDLQFLSGWFSCSGFIYTLYYLKHKKGIEF